MKRNNEHKCTLRTLEQELSRSSVAVDCQWSDSHQQVTLAGKGTRARDGQPVVLFYIPTNCTNRSEVTNKINSILDSMEVSAEVSADNVQGGADL